jgi:hypothetical protein
MRRSITHAGPAAGGYGKTTLAKGLKPAVRSAVMDGYSPIAGYMGYVRYTSVFIPFFCNVVPALTGYRGYKLSRCNA